MGNVSCVLKSLFHATILKTFHPKAKKCKKKTFSQLSRRSEKLELTNDKHTLHNQPVENLNFTPNSKVTADSKWRSNW